jgi:hypothetical protein
VRVSNSNNAMAGFEESLRQLIRDEILRLVRPEALTVDAAGNDLELRERAHDAASRLRRARVG